MIETAHRALVERCVHSGARVVERAMCHQKRPVCHQKRPMCHQKRPMCDCDMQRMWMKKVCGTCGFRKRSPYMCRFCIYVSLLWICVTSELMCHRSDTYPRQREVDICDMTHLFVYHDSFICVSCDVSQKWHIHRSDTYMQKWHISAEVTHIWPSRTG